MFNHTVMFFNAVFIVLLSILSYKVFILGYHCVSDYDCNQYDGITCAFCDNPLRHAIMRYTRCILIDVAVYAGYSPCRLNRDHCARGFCLNSDKHIDGYGECVCFCSESYYGKRCNHKGESGSMYPSGIQWIVPLHMEFNSPEPMLISVGWDANFDTKSKLSFIVFDTNGGYIARIQEPVVWDSPQVYRTSFSFEYCSSLFSKKINREDLSGICRNIEESEMFYSPTVLIPYNVLGTYMSDQSLNCIRRLQLDAYWDETFLSSHTINYHLSLKMPNYIMLFEMSGCSEDLRDPDRYGFADSIKLSLEKVNLLKPKVYPGTTTYVEEYKPSLNNIIWLWQAYKLEGDTDRNKVIDYFYRNSKAIQDWTIPGFSWKGTYVINVTYTALGVTYLKTNWNVCTLKVDYSPLKAVLSGGSTRFVYKEHGLTLDASGSRNPNTRDGKSAMEFKFACNWTTDSVCQPYITSSSVGTRYKIKPNELEARRAYEFTLIVSTSEFVDVKPALTVQIIVVGELSGSETSVDAITVECVYNCMQKVNPQDVLYLQVGGFWKRLYLLDFEWETFVLKEDGSSIKNETVNALRQKNSPPFIFILNVGALEENMTYVFTVTYKNTSQFATYLIPTSSSLKYSCKIDPKNGVAGVTVFNLSCTDSGSTQTCELYDKYESDETGFSGRLITTQSSCSVEKLILTRGRVEISSFDEYGMVTITTVNVQLSKYNRSIAEEYDDLTNMIPILNEVELLRRFSVLFDLVLSEHETDNTRIIEKLLKILSSLDIVRYEDGKQGISALYIALVSANRSLSFDATQHVACELHRLAKVISAGLVSGRVCTYKVVHQIYGRFMDCFELLLANIEAKYVLDESTSQLYVDEVVIWKLKETSHLVMDSFLFLRNALFYRQLPAQKYCSITSRMGTISSWIKVDIPAIVSKYTQEENRLNMFPVVISDELAQYVHNMDLLLGLHFITIKHIPVIFTKTNTENLVDLTVGFKMNDSQACMYPKILKYGIEVVFHISRLIKQVEFKSINISTKWLDLYKYDLYRFETNLPVFKIDPLPSSLVDTEFKLYDNDTALLVMVTKDVRPTFESLMEKGKVVNSKSPVFRTITKPSHHRQIYYLAVYPKNHNNSRIARFGMKVYSMSCSTWHMEWGKRGCRTEADHHTGALICKCNRLLLIGGSVKEEMFTLDVVSDFPLLLTLVANGGIKAMYLLILLLTFLLLAFVCGKADYKDIPKRYASVLPDNLPGDRHAYLVCVVTGARVGSGTQRAVGIKICGALNDGWSHILVNNTYDIMGGMGEDWFVIYEPVTLGTVRYLELWCDSVGAGGRWFCDSIIIYDIANSNCYYFLVKEWITVSLNRFPHVLLLPTPSSTVACPSIAFFDYVRSGFHLSHVWFNTTIRHPRDPVSRVDRLAVVLCFVLTSAAASVALIKGGDSNAEVDDYSYTLTWEMIELSVYACVPATIVAWLLIFLFNRIYTIIFSVTIKKQEIFRLRGVEIKVSKIIRTTPSTTFLTGDTCAIHYGKKEQKTHVNTKQIIPVTQKIQSVLMPKPLVPVQLEGDKPNVKIESVWLTSTWTIVVVIVIACIGSIVVLAQDLSPVKTRKWVTITFLAAGIHALIILPLKIILVSVLLSVLCKRMIYTDVFTFDPKYGCRSQLYGNAVYLDWITKLKSQPIYRPLTNTFREQHRQKAMRTRRWQRLYELFIRILLLFVIGALLGSNIPKCHQTNKHVDSLMKNVYKVFNNTHLIDFIQNHCRSTFFQYVWYNWKTLSQGSECNFFRKDWMYDRVTRMVGKATLAQLRVKQGYCSSPLNVSIDCAAPFTKSAEDTRNYSCSWFSYQGTNRDEKEDEIHPKLHLTSSDSQRNFLEIPCFKTWSFLGSDKSKFDYFGISGRSYSMEGYTWDLKASGEEFDVSLELLKEDGWVDHYSRAILMQTIIYNVNTLVFSELTLIAELTVTGQILPALVVNSTDVILKFDWWLAIFIFITFMFCIRVFVLTNFVGLTGLFNTWSYPYEALIAINACSVLYYISLHQLNVPIYITNYQRQTEELNPFDFYKISHRVYIARTLLCVLYILNEIRMYSLWRFGNTVYNFLKAVVLSLRHVLCLAGILVYLHFFLFRAPSYILLMFKNVDLKFHIHYRYLPHWSTYQLPSFQLLCFAMCFLNASTMVLCACSFIQSYRSAKVLLCEKDWTIENYFLFVKLDIKDILKTRHFEETESPTQSDCK